MLSGSPTSNRNAGGPGLDRQIVPGPSLILIEVAIGRLRQCGRPVPPVRLITLGNQTRSDANASEAQGNYAITPS
jgi:hypothetical protein